MSDFSSDDEDLPVSEMIGESEAVGECCPCGNSENLTQDVGDGKLYCEECWEQYERQEAAGDADYEEHEEPRVLQQLFAVSADGRQASPEAGSALGARAAGRTK